MGVVIPLDGAGNKKRASIEPLVKLTQADMDRVNEAILSHAKSHVELIPEIANHLINSGGIYWPISRKLIGQNKLLTQNPYWQ